MSSSFMKVGKYHDTASNDSPSPAAISELRCELTTLMIHAKPWPMPIFIRSSQKTFHERASLPERLRIAKIERYVTNASAVSVRTTPLPDGPCGGRGGA